MGADFVGWRDCSLQAGTGEESFLQKLKLRAYRRLIEDKIPAARRDVIRLHVDTGGRGVREMSYPAIVEQLGTFERGCAECKDCPLGGGVPLGCYHYITYPVDSVAERAIFEFFTSSVATPDSVCNQLFRDIVSHVPEDAAWYDNRGEDGQLAELTDPILYEWAVGDEMFAVDSAQILAASFVSLENKAMVVAYALYFGEMLTWIDQQIEKRPRMESRALEQSRTLIEIRGLYPMLLATMPYALKSNWRVVVDG